MAPRTEWGFFREKSNSAVTIRARAFEDLCERLAARASRLRILDFAAAPGIFDFFVQRDCAQYILADMPGMVLATPASASSTSSSLSPLPGLRDVSTSCTSHSQNDPGRDMPAVFDPGWFHAGQKLDAILVWDLLNYVPETVSRPWFQQLAPHCHDKTYAYVVLMQQPVMAARPARFRVLDTTQLRVHLTAEPMQSPRLSQYQLSKIMPGFVVYRSFLLQNGMQEYVLKFEGA